LPLACSLYWIDKKENTMAMFCYQCEQTANGHGCTIMGVCGKDASVAQLQDQLIYAAKTIASFAHHARTFGAKDRSIDTFIVKALFSTVTNVNFDAARLRKLLIQAVDVYGRAKAMYERAAGRACEKFPPPLAWWTVANGQTELVQIDSSASMQKRLESQGPDVTGLQDLLLFGLKGTAAYADHAAILGVEDDEVYAFFDEALDYLNSRPGDINELLGMVLKCGEVNIKVMGMLDAANTGTFGHPEPTKVRVTPIKGKCIAVSGHDLKDLEELLKQTQGKGINVYTHGEMLPCNAYPGLKKYKHLVGNYGGAWQDQAKEFDAFPGAILMTTNCIQHPRDSYKDRIFTTGLVAWAGVGHISDRNFAPVIEAAMQAPGFAKDDAQAKFITVGYGRNAVLGAAGAIVEAVQAGKIRHFFLIGGCDGAKSGRNYYTQFAQQVPNDCVILTLACGKYRFNKLSFGDIGGIDRLLDIGQCNDAYSAIQIAVALAGAFKCGVNDLPLSMILSWYEQKAVCILLSLLHLGIKNIRLGPSLPAFVSPAVLNVLVEKFNVMPLTTPQDDLQAILKHAK
jgi:hydroxylamine reductase